MAESRVAALEGNELADDYVRTHVPKGRWSDTWNLFKANFVKFVIINVLVLLFFVPGIILVVFKDAMIMQVATQYPISSNALGTFPYTPDTRGLGEGLVLNIGLLYNSLLIIAGFIASIGISGACYSVKKLINTHGKFTLKGFFHGVKVGYLSVVFPVTVFMVFLFGSLSISDWTNHQVALGMPKAGPVTAQVFMIIATVIVGVVCMWLLAVGVSYKVKFKYLIKNTFVLLFGTIIQSLFMVGFSLLPVWVLLLGEAVSFFKIIGYLIFIFFGFSFIVLCWMSFTQWVFDMFITPAVAAEEEVRKANLSPKELAAEKEKEEKEVAMQLLAAGKSELVGRPIRPIEGGTQVKEIGVAYGRADILRVQEQRKSIEGEVQEYYAEHKGDTRYVEYEKLFAEREKALNSDGGKKGKKKKLSRNNLLTK